eukprot:scaffold5017_cov139-Isochrysis_galbana.AAC.2
MEDHCRPVLLSSKPKLKPSLFARISQGAFSPTLLLVRTEVVHTVQSPPLQVGSCQVCRSMKGKGDRGLGEIGESEC